jgi:hypothetical protein
MFLCLFRGDSYDLCANCFPHRGHLKIYLGPRLGVLLLWGGLIDVLHIDFDMVLRPVGGAEIGPEAVNSMAYRGVKGIFAT